MEGIHGAIWRERIDGMRFERMAPWLEYICLDSIQLQNRLLSATLFSSRSSSSIYSFSVGEIIARYLTLGPTTRLDYLMDRDKKSRIELAI